MFQKEHRSELLKHFRRQIRCVKKRTVFVSRAPAYFLKCTVFFSRNVPCKDSIPFHVFFAALTTLVIMALI